MRGPDVASLGFALMAHCRRIHTAKARLGIRIGPGRHQSVARRIKSGRYRSITRAARLQMGRGGWRRRAPLLINSNEASLAHRIDRLIEDLRNWNI